MNIMNRGCISCSKLVLFFLLAIRIILAFRDATAGAFYGENGIIDLIFFPFLTVLTIVALKAGTQNSKTEGWLYIMAFIFTVLFELTTRWGFGQNTKWNSETFGSGVFQFYTLLAIIVGLFFYLIPGIILLFKKRNYT